MAKLYFMIFWIPAAASAVSLWIAWGGGILRRPLLFLTWLVVAFVLQYVASLFSPGWAIGLVLQVILAVYLGIRMRLDL